MSKKYDSTPEMLPLGQLWQKIRPENPARTFFWVGVALVLLLVESGTTVATPWVFSRMVAALSEHQALLAIPVWLIAQYTVIRVVAGISTPLREMLIAPLEADLQRRVALVGLEHLHALSVRFHLDRQTGALTRTLDRGSDAVGTLLSLVLFNVLPNTIELAMTLFVILRVFDWRYVAIVVAGIGVYAAVSYVFTRMRMTARRARNKANSQAQYQLVDSMLNFETVRSFANSHQEILRYDRSRQALKNAEIRLKRLVGFSQMARSLLIACATTALLGLAAHDIVLHRIGVAQFVLIGSYLRGLYSSVGALNYVSAGWRNARVDLENYLELLGTHSEIIEAPEPAHLPVRLADGGAARITFDHVSFSYDPARQILHDISLEIPAGTSLAIVGHTGSGKSTMGRLLTRAYDPTSGAIRIDGHDLRDVALEDLQRVIGTVPQDTVLFNTGIGENIAYGDPAAPEEAVHLAAQKAQIHDFISGLPEKYETVVGERGLKLSGGEKQRVAIARVLLKDPRILLLDEATSALDTWTEAAIQQELQELAQSRTTVIVAHRLSTVQEADQIVVLDAGRIVERGTHLELLRKNGYYARMWSVQAGETVMRA
ncbi:ABC transporter multidrug resistance [Gluconobacter thailandicus F149-1 = NBRC 100600]|uniref:ABC transporter ATP-binding protein n=1 Tax=Gluconobacter thailandicus NBRC 3257 TaxID=1381097 RepID=A0ABQ0ISH4_GLUTH|nr:ATP-binding cassette domain-containing protein [Gluconobacter thailandicus]KXV53319.1 ABC transporter ATP-binding protein [Gluconobacter thailandicus]GAC86956.1 ABC transporter ATP-binding protein [Gluconobacter thailandicus NBRC 3255]GAD25147.1 ABC transporter ATP-binding protein [Gluconobacter thailandicus NBRC 3257]GAN91923.1 ABC transporter multidrug resistance [Gluconobacter thailandicus F149-1 = NBRC 100600]GEL86298.1 ABC transport protein [Gluconobacter thailandicus F149-1 = NBRC 100